MWILWRNLKKKIRQSYWFSISGRDKRREFHYYYYFRRRMTAIRDNMIDSRLDKSRKFIFNDLIYFHTNLLIIYKINYTQNYFTFSFWRFWQSALWSRERMFLWTVLWEMLAGTCSISGDKYFKFQSRYSRKKWSDRDSNERMVE